jgi:hypothetical protein
VNVSRIDRLPEKARVGGRLAYNALMPQVTDNQDGAEAL